MRVQSPGSKFIAGYLVACMTILGSISHAETHGKIGSTTRPLCGPAVVGTKDPYDLQFRSDFVRNSVETAKTRAANYKTLGINILKLAQDLPPSFLYMIGVEHRTGFDYGEIIAAFKFAKPNIDTVFLEVSSNLNGLFEAYFEGRIDYSEISRWVQPGDNAANYITPSFMAVTKAMNIKVIGVEQNSTGSSLGGIMNLVERNKYSASEISKFFGGFLGRRDENPKLPEAIYIGGSGHLTINGAVPLNPQPVKSISRLLTKNSIFNQRIYLMKSDSNILRDLVHEGKKLDLNLTEPIAFIPGAYAPSISHKTESYDLYRWSDFSMVIIYP